MQINKGALLISVAGSHLQAVRGVVEQVNINSGIICMSSPINFTIMTKTAKNSTQANKLISEIDVQYLLVDRRYDTDEIIGYGASREIENSNSAEEKSQRVQIEHSQEIYESRYQIEIYIFLFEATGEVWECA